MKSILVAAALLIAGPASAADMPTKGTTAATNAYAAAGPTWGGLYIGGNVGWAKVDSDPSFGTDLTGWTYGGHIGFQVQKGWLVGGIETGVTNFSNVKANGFGCDCIVADLLGKVGVTVTPSVLVYGVGGGFWHNASLFGLPQFGWTAGGGIDWQPFNDHFIVGARYQYRNLDVPNTVLTVFAHELKLSLDYKF